MTNKTTQIRMMTTTVSLILGFVINTAAAIPVDDVLTQYQQQVTTTANPTLGATLWTKSFNNNKKQQKRSCSSCHTDNLRVNGKHYRTNKNIDPLAPSANKERLTDIKKIEKWLKRNCKWTLGRECSAKEKLDFLSYIRMQ